MDLLQILEVDLLQILEKHGYPVATALATGWVCYGLLQRLASQFDRERTGLEKRIEMLESDVKAERSFRNTELVRLVISYEKLLEECHERGGK